MISLRRVVSRFYQPPAVKRLVGEGDEAMRARDWAAAEGAYAEALARSPSMWPILVQFGHALKEQGFLLKAEQAYRRSLALRGTVADTHLQLGHVLKVQGRLQDAATAYKAAYRLDPASPDIARELAAIEPMLSGAYARRDQRAIAALQGALEAANLSLALLSIFDPQFYFYADPALTPLLGSADPARCIEHFGRVGIDEGRAVAAGAGFDATFYDATYLPDRMLTPVQSYRHWLGVGLPQGFAPNRRHLERQLFGALASHSVPGDLFEAARAAGQSTSAWARLFERFVTPTASPTLLDAFASAAETLLAGGPSQQEQGLRLVQRLIGFGAPLAPTIELAYARMLVRAQAFLPASAILRRVLAAGQRTAAVYDQLSECLEQLGDTVGALDVAAAGHRAMPGDPALRARVGTLCARMMEDEWAIALAVDEHGRMAGQARLAAVIARVAAAATPAETLAHRPIRRVAIVGNLDLPQCRMYRIDQKLEQFERAAIVARVFDFHAAIPSFLETITDFDAVIFYRVPASWAIIDAILKARENGLVTIYEIDDLIFDAAHYPAPLESYGGEINRRDWMGLAMGAPLFAGALRLCDHAIASTATLAEAMRPLIAAGQVFVHPNAMGLAHRRAMERPLPPRDDGVVTLFYGSGTKAHMQDFQELVEPALVELVRQHGSRISIVLVGFVATSHRLAAIADRLVLLPLATPDHYWARLATADINLAMLLPSRMADAKSEIKWMEAAMFGVPSVVSDTATYRAVVEDGMTGFLCADASQWLDVLNRLVVDADLRRRVGEQARRVAMERYGPAASADNLAAIMAGISPRQPAPMRPKIVIVNVYYPPGAIGGATRVVHDNVRQLTRRYGEAFAVEVFTTQEGTQEAYSSAHFAMDGVPVTAVCTPSRADIDSRTSDPKMGEVFDRFLARTKPDLVHFHCIQRLGVDIVDATRRREIPYVITAHDGWWISDHQFLIDEALALDVYDYAQNERRGRTTQGQPDRKALLRDALFGARVVAAVSAPFAALYQRCGVPNVRAIPNGVSNTIACKAKTTPPHTVVVGFVGGLERHKGLPLIRAAIEFGPLTGIGLLIVDHAMAPGTQRHERWGTVDVELIPRRPQSEVADLYARIDVLLAPSLWPESFGLVTREAAQSGCWIIASDRGDIGGDVTDGRDGFVIDVSTIEPLRRVLTQISADPGRFKSPPALTPMPRASSAQADDLARLYATILGAPQLPTPGITQ